MKKKLKFLSGLGIGVGLGILFAPKEGRETRRELKEKIDELLGQLKEVDIDDVKDSIEEKTDEIKLEIANFDKEKVLKKAEKKSKEIKKVA